MSDFVRLADCLQGKWLARARGRTQAGHDGIVQEWCVAMRPADGPRHAVDMLADAMEVERFCCDMQRSFGRGTR